MFWKSLVEVRRDGLEVGEEAGSRETIFKELKGIINII